MQDCVAVPLWHWDWGNHQFWKNHFVQEIQMFDWAPIFIFWKILNCCSGKFENQIFSQSSCCWNQQADFEISLQFLYLPRATDSQVKCVPTQHRLRKEQIDFFLTRAFNDFYDNLFPRGFCRKSTSLRFFFLNSLSPMWIFRKSLSLRWIF